MQVLSTRTMPPVGLPSPTFTNPDLILPWEQASSADSTPTTQQLPHRMPSPPRASELRRSRGEQNGIPRRVRTSGQSLSPFRNGVLTHGGPSRARSISEKGNGRIQFENSRLTYKPNGGSTGNASPASSTKLRHEFPGPLQRVIIESDTDEEEETTPQTTYKTPAILEEDDDNPNSHMAMSIRAEEILAIAKKRLMNMEGNLDRARTTLSQRPSSSMSSFANTGSDAPKTAGPRSAGSDRPRHAVSKHRQGVPDNDDAKQGHSRVFSETSVPSSMQTRRPKDHEQRDGAENGDQNSDNARHWFWNGLNRSTSVASKHNRSLPPLDEDASVPQQFEYGTNPNEEGLKVTDTSREARNQAEVHQAAANFDRENPPISGLTRSRSTAQIRDIRDQMQDLKGKISTLKRRARQDSLYRRSLSNLRTPSPFTAAEMSDSWYNSTSKPEKRSTDSNVDPILSKLQPHAPKEQEALPAEHGALAEDQNAMRDNVDPQKISETPLDDEINDTEAADERSVGASSHGKRSAKVINEETPAEDVLPYYELECPWAGCIRPIVDFRRHIAEHSLEESRNCPIDDCEEDAVDLGNADSLTRHVLLHYEGLSICRLCQQCFSQTAVFKQHLLSRHKVEQIRLDSKAWLDLLGEIIDREHIGMMAEEKRTREQDSGEDVETQSIITADNNDFHDAATMQGGERHEDRADAFDYEHVFLLSGLKHYSQQQKSASVSSDDSDDSEHSVETEKPNDGSITSDPRDTPQANRISNHIRNQSGESVSTDATFATADEGTRGEGSGQEQESTPRDMVIAPMRADSLRYRKVHGLQRPRPGMLLTTERGSILSDGSPVNGVVSLPTMPSLLGFLASMPAPDQQGHPLPSKPIKLGDQDREMAERLARSLAQVCIQLESAGAEQGRSKYEARVCRRKLDAARRVLDGEVNGEAF